MDYTSEADTSKKHQLELDLGLAVRRADGHGRLSEADVHVIANWICETETMADALALFRRGSIRLSVHDGELVFHYDEPNA